MPEKINRLINLLKRREPEFVTKGIAAASYITSIGRVLEKRGVDKFQEMAWVEIQKLSAVKTTSDFDVFHDGFIYNVMKTIKTNNGKETTYGQAQKPVNVFLKIYIDQARLPDPKLAGRIKPFLHVPLDKNIMEYFYEEFPAEYKSFVQSYVHQIIGCLEEHAKKEGYSLKPKDKEFFELRRISSKPHYYAWQNLFRNLWAERPVMLDMVYELRSRHIPIEL